MLKSINIVDVFLGAFLIFGFIRGLYRGFVLEVASIFALVLGGFGAIRFSGYAVEWISSMVELDIQSVKVISLIITFLVIAISVGILGEIITKLLKLVALGGINSIFGGIFGVLKWVILMGLFLVFAQKLGFDFKVFDKEIQTSFIYSQIHRIGSIIYQLIR